MAHIAADCPRCGRKQFSFQLVDGNPIGQQGWRPFLECYCIGSCCYRGTVFVLAPREPQYAAWLADPERLVQYQGGLNTMVEVEGYVRFSDRPAQSPPDHLPLDVEKAFREGAVCLSTDCYNAAAAMFRLAIDLATVPLLPPPEDKEPAYKVRRDLGLRMKWLFDTGKLPEPLRDLAACVREDGNDAAHRGSLDKEDADDLLDFTTILLERLYTEPKNLEIANQRRLERRKDTSGIAK